MTLGLEMFLLAGIIFGCSFFEIFFLAQGVEDNVYTPPMVR